jgi:tRNA 2-thiouridine synthesizing protein E
MPTMEHEGKSYDIDEEGYLTDWSVWNEGLAGVMAKEDGLDLSDEHWEVIKFLRDYFEKYQIAPMIKILTKELKGLLPYSGTGPVATLYIEKAIHSFRLYK